MQYIQDYDDRLPITYTDRDSYYSTDASDATTENIRKATLNFYSSNSPNALGLLKPYLQTMQVMNCPSAAAGGTAANSTSYAANGAILFTVSRRGPRHIASVQTYKRGPEQLIYMQERITKGPNLVYAPRVYTDYYSTLNYDTNLYDGWHSYVAATQTESFSNAHFEGGNLLFCDGHVKWRPYESLNSGEFGLERSSAPKVEEMWSPTNWSTLYLSWIGR